MSTECEVRSCLSPNVHYLVCKLGLEEEEKNLDIESILLNTGVVCWKTITVCIKFIESENRIIDYVESIRCLGPVCKTVHTYMKSMTPDCFDKEYGIWFNWTNRKEVFLEVFSFLSSSETSPALCLMKLTSTLERALGDVHVMMNNECPFLLKTLLLSKELSHVFGAAVMDVLRVFMGSPKSLNLRNLLWHGFASPQEIPSMYCSMLLLMVVGLGQIFQNYKYRTDCILVHRNMFSFSQWDQLFIFPVLCEEALSLAEGLIKKSDFVLSIMLPYWQAGITAYREERYADSLMFILPQMECSLRCVYTRANNCPHRLQTAESEEFYTTLDEILAKNVKRTEINALPTMLGEPIMELLWDLLNNPEGPRIRDHLSHGEVDLTSFPRVIANEILASSLVLLYKFIGKPCKELEENEIMGKIVSSAETYSSQFHPIGKLRNQVLKCIKQLQDHNDLPRPPQDQIERNPRFQSSELQLHTKDTTLKRIIFCIQKHFPEEHRDALIVEEYIQDNSKLFHLPELWNHHISTLYCPRAVLEVVSLLRKIVSQCSKVTEQVVYSSESRYTEWMNKSLRSRQRITYIHLLNSTQYITPAMRLLLLICTVYIFNVYNLCAQQQMQDHLKFLKLSLQFAENLVTFTNSEKNKWSESINLIDKYFDKVELFFKAINFKEDKL
ncbi:endoplasmic reticulum membrane-associated RNA degradation protein-like isoform X2 [Erpetoichthys calabaricus]|nr:endoplasmic reticulum membrane-associated RNA degradation protein-like isoform X2 [Erpetoichthys calabaricus]